MTAYWLDLFTLETWRDFKAAGREVSGFRERRSRAAGRIARGDTFLCYLTGVQRWVGALQVESAAYHDTTPMWTADVFPVRFRVRPIVFLEPEHGIPAADLANDLEMVRTGRWGGIRRGSPTRLDSTDGEKILQALKRAEADPVERPLTPKGLAKARLRQRRLLRRVGEAPRPPIESVHTRVQWKLLQLGSALGLDIWVARNDRGRSYEGRAFRDLPALRQELGLPLPQQALSIVEMIDVLWLDGSAITAAFEIEHTSSIYSGILRMSDLVASFPHLNIRLYLVAPEERRNEVCREMTRPTFARLQPPLREACKYIPIEKLESRIEQLGDALADIRPSFIDRIAEQCPSAP